MNDVIMFELVVLLFTNRYRIVDSRIAQLFRVYELIDLIIKLRGCAVF